MILIKKYKIRKAGSRGQIVSIPDSYMEEMGLKTKDMLRAYRVGKALIYVPEGDPVPTDEDLK